MIEIFPPLRDRGSRSSAALFIYKKFENAAMCLQDRLNDTNVQSNLEVLCAERRLEQVELNLLARAGSLITYHHLRGYRIPGSARAESSRWR